MFGTRVGGERRCAGRPFVGTDQPRLGPVKTRGAFRVFPGTYLAISLLAGRPDTPQDLATHARPVAAVFKHVSGGTQWNIINRPTRLSRPCRTTRDHVPSST